MIKAKNRKRNKTEKMFDFSLVFSTCVWYDEDTEHMVYFYG